MTNKTYCGFVAIIGRPNVGKSTLLNQLIAKKISITSDKPQTTRHRISGVKTVDNKQIVYVDTPGMHSKTPKAINRVMNKAATGALRDVDVAIFIVDCTKWTDDDEMVLDIVSTLKCPVILALNKIDLVKDKSQLLPKIDKLSKRHSFSLIIPLSAKKADNVENLEAEVLKYLPESEHFFPEDMVTDRNEQFLLAEIIREKLTRLLGEELPYELTVQIESLEKEKDITKVRAIIWVEKPGQKIIIIGEKGAKLKEIATKARIDMETLLNTKVFLNVWIKIKSNWSNDDSLLHTLGVLDKD
jgi:GTPase